MSHLVGAYVCPRGVFGVECRRRRKGMEVVGTFSTLSPVNSPESAGRLLVQALADAGIKRAEVAVALRGFDVVHHVLSLPPAPDAVIEPIVERELRRLEPQMVEPIVAWTRLPAETVDPGEPPPQPQVLAAAMSREVSVALATGVRAGGHTLTHLTALPVAFHRIADEFLSSPEPTVLLAALPDGPYLGFSVAGAVRLVVEPPVPAGDPLPDATALAEEAELGAVFVRQQFRGAQISRAVIAASPESYADLEAALGARLGVVVSRLPVGELGAEEFAAFGALLDADAARPISLGGGTERRAESVAPGLRLAATVTVALAALAGVLAGVEGYRARSTAQALQVARRQIDQESFGFAPVRETAERRKLVRDAVSIIQLAAREREAIQRGLASVASAVPSGVHLDSIVFERGVDRWQALIGGTVVGRTSGQAVETLNDFYRELPRRSPVDSLALKELSYADTAGGASVHFQMAFGLRGRKRD